MKNNQLIFIGGGLALLWLFTRKRGGSANQLPSGQQGQAQGISKSEIIHSS